MSSHCKPLSRTSATRCGDVVEPPLQRGESENPLLWMFRRKDRTGDTLIGPAGFAAGERLRSDLTFSGILPRVTMNWSSHERSTPSAGGVRLAPAEAALAARQRVDQAMRAVGPEFAGLLMDVCGFWKGLELIERERSWPPRSAKVVVKLALASLARHYGYEDTAIGRAKGLVSWKAPKAPEEAVAPIS